jgi:hypothetical protein
VNIELETKEKEMDGKKTIKEKQGNEDWEKTAGGRISRIVRGCIQKFPDWVDNEIYAYNNKNSLRSNTKGYGGKTH